MFALFLFCIIQQWTAQQVFAYKHVKSLDYNTTMNIANVFAIYPNFIRIIDARNVNLPIIRIRTFTNSEGFVIEYIVSDLQGGLGYFWVYQNGMMKRKLLGYTHLFF